MAMSYVTSNSFKVVVAGSSPALPANFMFGKIAQMVEHVYKLNFY